MGIATQKRALRNDRRRLGKRGAAVSRSIAGEPPQKGGILAALRRSPLVGADLNLTRSRGAGRKVDL
jgi:hypothetical protein